MLRLYRASRIYPPLYLACGDSTIELDKKTINLDVNGTQQTVNVTSNDSWTWAQAAARTVLRMMGR